MRTSRLLHVFVPHPPTSDLRPAYHSSAGRRLNATGTSVTGSIASGATSQNEREALLCRGKCSVKEFFEFELVTGDTHERGNRRDLSIELKVPGVCRQMLMVLVGSVSFRIRRVQPLQLLQDTRWKLFVDVLVYQLTHVRRALGRSRLILPSLKSVNLFEELVRKSLNPRSKLRLHVGLEDSLKFLPRSDLLIASGLID